MLLQSAKQRIWSAKFVRHFFAARAGPHGQAAWFDPPALLGEQTVKNIERPIRVYYVLLEGTSSATPPEVAVVTVMFSDLVGSTALSARMDPEDLREVISAYQKCVADAVQRFGGFVAKYMGDGVLVYFGYPQAHEDDAERAVRAGLDLVAAVGPPEDPCVPPDRA